MALKKYHCLNWGNCEKADSRTTIQILEGQEAICPKCEMELMEIRSIGWFRKILRLTVVAILIVAIGIGFYLFLMPPKPTVTLSSDPTNLIYGESATLTWTSTNADEVSIDQGIDAKSINDSITVTPDKTTKYTISATGKGGKAIAFVTINVTPQKPTVTLRSDISDLIYSKEASLTWSSTNSERVFINNGIGVVKPSGSIKVSPAETTTYSITASGKGGAETKSVTINVFHPKPSVNFIFSENTIISGESVTLTWKTINADKVTIDQGLGKMDINGSISVSPTETTDYTITASGKGGVTTNSVTIYVTHPKPTIEFNTNLNSIISGRESATLTWESKKAEKVIINNGIGEVALNGSLTVLPLISTSYIASAIGKGGKSYATVTIKVIHQKKFEPIEKNGMVFIDNFWIDKYEVSIAEYKKFDPYYTAPEDFSDDMPLVDITWTEANQFAEKQGKRLCRNSEWILALGILDSDLDVDNAHLNMNVVDLPQSVSISKEYNKYNLYNMIGNVSEWIDTGGNEASFIGGYWFWNLDIKPAKDIIKTNKIITKDTHHNYIGFRCCCDDCN